MKQLIAACLAALSLGMEPSHAQNSFPGSPSPIPSGTTVWERLKIGGGGYGTRVSIANDGSRVFGTDISNAYVWPVGATEWRSCVNYTAMIAAGMTVSVNGTYHSPWDIQIAPNNSNRIYMLYGAAGASGDTKMYRSDDQCQTWKLLSGYPGMTYRGAATHSGGQRIAVDPSNSDVVYVGDDNGKVWRTLNAGTTWSVVPGVESAKTYAMITSGSVISAVNGTTTLSGVTVSKEVYINAFGVGVWHSADGGNSFAQIAAPSNFKMQVTVPSIPAGALVYVIGQTCTYTCSGASPTIYGANSANLKFNTRLAGYTENNNGGRKFATFYSVAGSSLKNEVISVEYSLVGVSLPSIAVYVITGQDARIFDSSEFSGKGNTSAPTISTNASDTMVISAQVNNGQMPTAGYNCDACGGVTIGSTSNQLGFISGIFSSPQKNVSPTMRGGNFARGGVTEVIKAASPGSLVRVSFTHNMNWNELTPPNQPYQGRYGKVSCNNTYYLGQSNGPVWKWKAGKWSQLSMPGGVQSFMAYPHPTDCDKIFVALQGRATHFNTSTDAGATWQYSSNKLAISANSGMTQTAPNVPWYQNPWWSQADTPMNSLDLGDAQFNPVTDELEMATGFCYYVAKIPFARNATFNYEEKCPGSESVVTAGITSVPGGPTYFGVLDLAMFANLSTTSYPAGRLPQFNYAAGLSACTSVTYSGLNPSYVFALCNQSSYGPDLSGYTTTASASHTGWYLFGGDQNPRGHQNAANIPPLKNGNYKGSIAVNACDPNNVIILQSPNVTNTVYGNMYVTTNALAKPTVSWSLIDPAKSYSPPIRTSGPNGWVNMVADFVNCDTFYAYNVGAGTGGIYKTTNKGVSWTRVHSGNLFSVNMGYTYIAAVPGRAGELYATPGYTFGDKPMANTPFKHSTDGGATWKTCPGVQNVYGMGFGAGPGNNQSDPSIYVIGWQATGKVYGVWRSNDRCQTWTNLTPPSGPQPSSWKELGYLNSPQPANDKWVQDAINISGDMNTYGKVYVGMRPGSGFVQGTLH